MPDQIRIYDNGGRTYDRYTLVIPSIDTLGKLDMYGFNENPYHPQGFGQYSGTYAPMKSYAHLGKSVDLDDLPDQAKKFVVKAVSDYAEVAGESEKPKYTASKIHKASRVHHHGKSPAGLGGVH